jgi:N-acetylglutamate synthase-like GNAT family acetyltransferase
MGIRRATLADHDGIKKLIDQLDYPGSDSFLLKKMEIVINNPLEELLVYEWQNRVVAFIVLEFLPQLGLEGDIARIGYFAVDNEVRSKGIGKEMEEYCDKLAREKNCDRIEVHCHERRKDAHRFYFRQGYFESPKYLMKSLRKKNGNS